MGKIREDSYFEDSGIYLILEFSIIVPPNHSIINFLIE